MLARRFALLTPIGFVLAACRSSSNDLRVRADDLEDRRVTSAESWEPLLARESDEVRARAARAVGRVRDPGLAPPLLRALHVESDERVRSEQLFALGQIGDASALEVLLEGLDSNSPALRAAAAEAIGKLGVPHVAANLVAHLADPSPDVRGAALLALARLVGRRGGAAARGPGDAPLDPDSATVFLHAMPSLLADPEPSVRWKAAYALSEVEIAGRQPSLSSAAGAPDALVRFFATAGIARLPRGSAVDLARLVELLGDEDVYVAANAATALGRFGGAEMLEPLEEAAGRVANPASFHERRAAVAARCEVIRRLRESGEPAAVGSPNWLFRPATRWNLTHDPSLSVRAEVARCDLQLAGSGNAARSARRVPDSGDRHERVVWVRALGASSYEFAADELVALASDRDAYVASEALTALKALAPAADANDADAGSRRARLRELARQRSSSPDVAVAGSALELLQAVGAKDDLAIVAAAYDRHADVDGVEARTTAVHAAAALAAADSIALLRRARGDESPAVVAAAKQEWKRLALPEEPPPPRPRSGPPVGPDDGGSRRSSIELEPGVDFLSDDPNPRVVLQFAKGAVEIELLREEAPRHVKMLLARVRDGRCDGLPIHRVVTGFVVQGLDPRGDGWGTGGVFLRDEINRVPFERGSVGMPNAGPDSGGCQIFVTLVPTPHLDGRYTVFGRVVAGMDVVDTLDLGDACTKAQIRK